MNNLTRKIIFLLRKNIDGKGFALTENLMALMVLTITLSSMFPAFMNFSVENSKHRILSGAIALANNQLENLRRQDIGDLTPGSTTQANLQNSGYSYKLLTQYICTAQPTNISSTTPTCPTTVNANDSSRYILIKVQGQTNENIYSVQTVFTILR